MASGEWKSAGRAPDDPELLVDFEVAEYLRYREAMRADIEATRARYGGSDRYAELEYRQLLDHAFIEGWLLDWFGERVDVVETLRQQRGRPKLEYLRNPESAAPFVEDSISRGFAPAPG